MRTVSSAFRTALAGNHSVAVGADIYRAGALVVQGLQVLGGTVNVDATAAVRRRCTVTIVDPDGTLTPSTAADELAPYGNELRISRGIVLDTGPEILPLGVFSIAAVSVIDEGHRIIRVTGYDRSRKVARARFTEPYVVAEGTNYSTAIKALLESRVDGLTFLLSSTSFTTPALVFAEDADPWAEATKMAKAIGFELFFGPDDITVLRPEPDPANAPLAWEYVDGENATFVAIENTLSDEPGYNGVVVIGEHPSLAAPVRAEAWDADPASPTYYLGPYGRVPTFVRSQFISTTTQAQDAADAQLQRVLGGTEQLRFTAIPNPAHEAGDVVRVVRDELGLDDFVVLDAFDIPLEPEGLMPVVPRKRRSLV